jgi:hypothetical protein
MAVKFTDQGHEFSKRKIFYTVSSLIFIITISRSKFKYILIRLRNVTQFICRKYVIVLDAN